MPAKAGIDPDVAAQSASIPPSCRRKPASIPKLRRSRYPCVYILASRPHGTLYVGVTSDLIQRVWQHKENLVDGFTRRYRVHDLVWFERHDSMLGAIARERAIKEWKRRWKIELIETENPLWRDLYPGLSGWIRAFAGMTVSGQDWIPAFAGMTVSGPRLSSGFRRNDESRQI
jgi:putative endonuclease